MSNKISLEKRKEYVNLREWIRKAKKRWGMKKEEAKQKWKDFLADDRIPKAYDQMGWLALPALHVFACDAQCQDLSIELASDLIASKGAIGLWSHALYKVHRAKKLEP